MEVLIAFFAALAVAQGGFLSHEPGVRTTFNILNPFEGFFDIPKTCEEAVAAGWNVEDRPDASYLPVLVLYCYKDKRVCVLFDDTCYFAGMQFYFIKNNFENCYLFNDAAVMENRAYNNCTVKIDGTSYDAYWIGFYTIDQVALETSAADRINSRDNTRILQFGYVWVKGPGGIRKISTKQVDIETEGIFTKQAFIPCMGVHDYYKMTENTACTSDYLYPWFALTHQGEMVALGLMTFGNYTVAKGERDWNEHPSESAVRMIVPHGPECLYKLVNECGIFTTHTYFIAHPCSSIIFE